MGKTFMTSFLSVVYNYHEMDATLEPRDAAGLFNENANGVVFDVPRSCRKISYATIEGVKNGKLFSGKYEGVTLQFAPMPVVVFANFEPETNGLSRDRWNIIRIFPLLEEQPEFNPSLDYGTESPVPLPDLSENFNFRAFLRDNRILGMY